MKYFLPLLLCCALSCIPNDFSQANRVKSDSYRVLNNLVYVDMHSPDYNTQHPLVCGAGKDFPAGSEMIFINTENDMTVHAVFPDKTKVPTELDRRVALRGYFQGIQSTESYKWKKPDKQHRYFVVSSWNYMK